MYKTAVQAFALRDELEADFPKTVELIIEGGFDGFEAGLYFGQNQAQIMEALKKLVAMFGKMPGFMWSNEEAGDKIQYMKEKGLIVESCHLFFTNSYEGFFDDYMKRLLDFAKDKGIRQYVVGLNIASEEDLNKWKPILAKAAQEMKSHDIKLAYHNQDMEMALVDGKSILERLLDDVDSLYLQPDLGWMEAGGGQPKSLLEKYLDRIISIHFKDLLLEPWKEKNLICTPIGGGDVDSLVLMPFLEKMNLLEAPLIIDQDNARGLMMDELMMGKEYILNHIV